MKRDIKYIIKRILIGAGIALLLGFLKENVYAAEVNDLHAGNNTQLIDYTTLGNVRISEVYNNYYNNQYIVPVYNYSTHRVGTPPVDNTTCTGKSRLTIYSSNIGANEPYNMPSNPSSPYLSANYACSNYSKQYLTLSTIVLDFMGFTMEKDKYYKINLYFLNDYQIPSRVTLNTAINDPEDLKVEFPTNLEPYSMYYAFDNYNEGPFVSIQNSTNTSYNWLTISLIVHAVDDVVNPIIFFGYSPNDTLISGNSTYPTTFTSNDHLPLLLFNYNVGNSSWANANELKSVRPFVYEYIVEDPSIQIPDFSSMAEDTLSDINDDIQAGIENGEYTTQNELDAFSGGGGGAGIAFGGNNLSDILVIPLRFMQKFNTNTTCEPLEIPLPKLNSNVALPCMSTFYSTFLGSDIFNIVQLIIGVGLGFKICMAFYYTILDILDPQKIIT